MSRSDWLALVWLLDYMLWLAAFSFLVAGLVDLWRWAKPRLKAWWSKPITITITTTTTTKWWDE